MRWKLWIGGLAAALVVVGSVGYANRADRADSQREAVTSTRTSHSHAADTLRLPEGEFETIRPELERLALAGNAEAAYRLATIIAHCQDYTPLPFGTLAAQVAEFVARGSKLEVEGRALDEDEFTGTVLFAYRKREQTCASTDGLHTENPERVAFAWIERAASLGHSKAMVEYPDRAFAEFHGENALLENASQVALRRDRARVYLKRALQLGDTEALAAIASAHREGTALEKDPVKALAHWLAYEHRTTEDALPASLRSVAGKRFREGLSEEQQRDAAAQALRWTTEGPEQQ